MRCMSVLEVIEGMDDDEIAEVLEGMKEVEITLDHESECMRCMAEGKTFKDKGIVEFDFEGYEVKVSITPLDNKDRK